LQSSKLGLLDVNGQKGFNFGLGLVPKLIWMYYGKGNDKYVQLQKQICDEERIVDLSPVEQQQYFQGVLRSFFEVNKRKGGPIGVAKTAVLSISEVLSKPIKTNKFYAQPLDGKFYIDGKEQHFPRDVISVYSATYEQVNFGIKGVWPKVTPQARSVPGKMQIVISWDRPLELIPQIPFMFFGKHLQNAAYVHCNEFVFEPKKPTIAQLDAEYQFGEGFKIKYDRELNIIAPFAF